jgi:hypothetical protein
MKDTSHTDDWRSLCEQASHESDPQKLLELVAKINRALEEYRQPGQSDEASLTVDTVLLPANKSSQYDLDLYRFPGECSAQFEYDC